MMILEVVPSRIRKVSKKRLHGSAVFLDQSPPAGKQDYRRYLP